MLSSDQGSSVFSVHQTAWADTAFREVVSDVADCTSPRCEYGAVSWFIEDLEVSFDHMRFSGRCW